MVVVALALPCTAEAQGSSVHDTAAARSLFQEGITCADAHDWVCAADRFGRAHALRASPVIAYNLGAALVALGRIVEGSEHLLRVARDEAAPAPMRSDAQRAADAVAGRIARVVVRTEGSTEGVTLTIDGRALSASLVGAAAPVDPGEHLVEASRGSDVIASAHFAVEPGAAGEVSLALPDPPPEPPREAPTVTSEPIERIVERVVMAPAPPSDDAPWIGLGVGIGVVVIAGAIVIAVLLAPPSEPSPYMGSLGTVEVGR